MPARASDTKAAAGAAAIQAPAEAPADLVVLGRLGTPYGVRGWLRMRSHGEAGDGILRPGVEVWLGSQAAGRTALREARAGSTALPVAAWHPFGLLELRSHGEVVLLQFDRCTTREDAARLVGLDLAVSRASFPPADPDEYYWVDLIGCEVLGQEGASLGQVVSVEDFGAPHPVLAVAEAGGGRQVLIPFVAAVITQVDLAARRIVADWGPDY